MYTHLWIGAVVPKSVEFAGVSAAGGTGPVLGQPGLHVGEVSAVGAALAPRVDALDQFVADGARAAHRVAVFALHLLLGQRTAARRAVHEQVRAVVVQLIYVRQPTQVHHLK